MRNRDLRMAVLAALSAAGAWSAAHAQDSGIAFDGSLPGTTAGVLDAVNGNYAITHERGLLAGSNLFHSFDVFNLKQGETAVFSGNAAITNIISRVTGGLPTTIDGTIRSSIAGANFWMVNPAGLTVGPSGAIDVSGAVALGAADSIDFADGGQFFALPDGRDLAVSLLVASPVDFGFLANSMAGAVVIQNGEFLARSTQVAEERQIRPLDDNSALNKFSLLLSGRAGVMLDSAANLSLAHARIRAGSSSFAGPIQLTAMGSIDIHDSDLQTRKNLNGAGDQAIFIQGGELVTISRSSLVAQSGANGAADDISIDGAGVRIDQTQITAAALRSGDVFISAGAEGAVLEATRIDTSSSAARNNGAARSGTIDVKSAGQLRLDRAALRSDAVNGAAGDIGLSAETVQIRDSSITASSTASVPRARRGRVDNNDAGDITIAARGTGNPAASQSETTTAVTLSIEGSTLRTNARNDGAPSRERVGGNAGLIDITATRGALQITGNSLLESAALGVNSGAGGAVQVTAGAEGALDIADSTINIASETRNGNVISVAQRGDFISITGARAPIRLSNSKLTATTRGVISAGDVSVIGASVDFNGATLQTSSTGTGVAGAIVVSSRADDLGIPDAAGEASMPAGSRFVRIAGSRLETTTGETPLFGGNITISADATLDIDGSILNASIVARGPTPPRDDSPVTPAVVRVGNIQLFAGNAVSIVDSEVVAQTSGVLNGGNIDIGGSSLLVQRSDITTSSTATDPDVDPNPSPAIPADPDADIDIDIDTEPTAPRPRASAGLINIQVFSAVPPADVEIPASEGESALPPPGPIVIESSTITSNALVTNGGDVNITGVNSELAVRDSRIEASTGGPGRGGSILISGVSQLTLRDSKLRATAEGGTGGKIDIALDVHATGSLSVVGTEVATNAAAADGGNIALDANGRAVLLQDSSIVASARGTGRGGAIDIRNAGGATVRGSKIQSSTVGGTGGAITLGLAADTSGMLSIENSAITTEAIDASGGNISFDAAGHQVAVLGSRVQASAGGGGTGGNISIDNAAALTVRDSEFQALANAGTGGTISFALTGESSSPLVFDSSLITTNAAAATGGDILIDAAGHQVVMRDSIIRASAGAGGPGGNVRIDNAGRTLLQRSQVLARADAGNGGTITINLGSGALFIRDAQSTLSADSNSGNDGAIDINSPDTDLNPAVKPQAVSIDSTPELCPRMCTNGRGSSQHFRARVPRRCEHQPGQLPGIARYRGE